jgi:hypothetical protein
MSQILVTGEAKIRDIQGPVVSNSGVITALDGDASQYVRGDGTLADFPTSTGGGSSVSYYLNSSVSQGTIGGVAYKQLGKTPISGAGTDIAISTTGYIASYITDANDPALLEVPAGNFNCEFYFSVNNNTGNPFVYAEVYKYDGTTFTLIGTSVGVPEYITEGTVINPYYFAVPVSTSVLTVTDRISIRIYVNVDGRTVTLHTENNHLCQVVTTFSKGLISLNNLTRQNQFFATGSSGTDFNISSTTATHTFNLPVASATNTGKLSSIDWSTFNGKVPYTGATTNVDLGINNIFASFVYAEGAGGSLNGGILIKQYSGALAANAGYTSLFATPNQLGINFGGIYNTFLQSATLTASRTFTLPDVSGTLALLEGSQTFSGKKTFSNGVNITGDVILSGGIGYGGGIRYVQGIIQAYGSNETTTEFTDANSIKYYVGQGSTNYKNFVFDVSNVTLNATRTYNLPDASGTLALTSNLSSYVPYTGATANVDLAGFSLYLNNSQAIFGRNFTGTTAYALIGVNPSNKVSIDTSALGAVFGGDVTGISYIANGLGSQGGTIALKQNGLMSAGTGYTTLGSLSAGQLVIYFGDANLYAASFLNTSLTDSRSYTLPNASGTLALLSGTQTFTGATTFSLDISVNGLTVGRGAGGSSTNAVLGTTALNSNTTGTNNVAVGGGSLFTNTTGSQNTALGAASLYFNTTGGNNTAIGNVALQGNTTGVNNTAIGSFSSYVNTTGQNNTSVGASTLIANTTGSQNTAIGSASLQANTTGESNVGLGVSSLGVNTIGQYNVAVGKSASNANTTGNYNTALGGQALGNVTTGSQNIAIGYNSGGGITTGSQNTIIGIVTGLSSTLSNNIILADGGGNIRYQWNGTNNVFGNPISGTSATFSAGVTFAGGVYNFIGANRFFAAASGSINYLYTGSTNLTIVNQADTATLFTLANTGAATFSSSIDVATTARFNSGGNWMQFETNVLTSLNNDGAHIRSVISTDANPTYSFKGDTNTGMFNAAADVLGFSTAGVERMRITSGGNVGIGNTGATDVRLLIKAVDTTGSNYGLIVNNSSNANLFYVRNDGLFLTGSSAASPYNLGTSGRGCIIESNGVLGYQSSTRESKINIEQLSDVSWLYQLNPVSFNYRKKDNEMNYTNEAQEEKCYGLIADEVEKVNKDLVFYNVKEDGTKQLAGVEYNKLISALVKSVQELEARIKQLENK